MTDEAKAAVVKNFSTAHAGSRFPAFWGPNFDWIPDQDHGSVACIALQRMVLQADDGKLHLRPAFPNDWDVEFKLHAPGKTVVEGRLRNPLEHVLTHSDAQGHFAIYPPKDQEYEVIALHPQNGIGFISGKFGPYERNSPVSKIRLLD